MQSSSNFNQGLSLPDIFSKTAYEALQGVKAGFSLAHKSVSTEIGKLFLEHSEQPVPLAS
ncbi:MAG: hypothetical protein AB4058_19845 [Microcystaceae cyanobacterium]